MTRIDYEATPDKAYAFTIATATVDTKEQNHPPKHNDY